MSRVHRLDVEAGDPYDYALFFGTSEQRMVLYTPAELKLAVSNLQVQTGRLLEPGSYRVRFLCPDPLVLALADARVAVAS